MENFAYIKKLLAEHKIYTLGALRLSDCKILREYKLKNAGFNNLDSLFVYIFAVPYYTEGTDERNISRYAIARDYHSYFKELFEDVTSKLSDKFPEFKFAGFTDNSPIDERHAAARANLGVIGKNGLLITEKYSSFVFLGEIITDLPTTVCKTSEISSCINCGKCIDACPMKKIGECLSSLTQKKGELTDTEAIAIKTHGYAWGCDICQDVCPYTKAAIDSGTIYTEINFFKENLTPYLNEELLLSMSDEEFTARAYSWRKKETVLRNLEILSE